MNAKLSAYSMERSSRLKVKVMRIISKHGRWLDVGRDQVPTEFLQYGAGRHRLESLLLATARSVWRD